MEIFTLMQDQSTYKLKDKIMRKLITTTAVFLFLTVSSLQANNKLIWHPIKDIVSNYQSLADQISKEKIQIQIRIPKQVISHDNQKLYAFVSKLDKNNYTISFDTTSECHGAKYCQAGYISGKLAGNPEIYYDLQNKKVTSPVDLNAKVEGYFTKGHPMGDYWPPMIEWRQGNTLYTLSWNLPEPDTDTQKIIMKKLANYTLM